MLYARSGVTPIRDFSARINSYDGRGHAYIFAIVSEQPLHFEDISDGPLWNDVDVPNYMWNPDPRRSIKDFADAVAHGEPYTLRYANSYQTTTFVSYADALWTCSVLSTLSYSVLHSLGYYGYHSYCPGTAYSLLDTYFFRARPYNPWGYAPTSTSTTPGVTPRRPDSTAAPKPAPGLPSLELLPMQKRVHVAERIRLVGDAEEEFAPTNRPELGQGQRTLIAPRRAVDDDETPRMNTFDQRRTTYGHTSRVSDDAAGWERRSTRAESPRADNPRAERAERQAERAERAAPAPRAERPQAERTERSAPAPAPRAETHSEPAPPRPRPPSR
jgi:hypothetical protein